MCRFFSNRGMLQLYLVGIGGQEVDETRKSHETLICEAMASVLMTTATTG